MSASEIRKDLVRDNWVVIATGRAIKPTDLPVPAQGTAVKKSGFCPFCEGNEMVTPPEILANRIPGSKENGPGWTARTIPNKFSAFSLETPFKTETNGIYSYMSGFGVHEVVLETPEHDTELHENSAEKISEVVAMLKARHLSLAGDERIKFIQTYKNKGLFAGASLGHSHMQTIALPYVPDEFRGATEYARNSGNCLFCHMIDQERKDGSRLVYESENFIVFCPFASRFAHETWILPKNHGEDFGKLPEENVAELSIVLKMVLESMVGLLNDPSYNIIINSAPVNVAHEPGYHWYIEIFPRLIVQAGVEIATGYHMNPISPEWAAETLKASIEGKSG
ncbi:MAG: galactose-1-phosphate uridylyltransferase [Syntrophomonadaceae bacterium]|nr:galactose-1-phosphate uridylyltransferase [Syntrophomonadaceae bacterium]